MFIRSITLAMPVLLAIGFVKPGMAGGLDDNTIFAIFDQANMADIATGRLGFKKSASPEIQALAKMVVTDHTAVQHMGRDLAGKFGLLGNPPDADASWADLAKTLADLDRLSGKAFDAAYLRYEIAFHAAVIGAIETTLLPAIRNPELKTLVETVLPGFRKHLAMTKDVADKLGVAY